MKEYYNHIWEGGLLTLKYNLDDVACEKPINGGVIMMIVDEEHDVNMINIRHISHITNFRFKVIGVTDECDFGTTIGYEIDLDKYLKDGIDYSFLHG